MLPRSIFYALAGCLAVFAFTSDIVADSIADAYGEHCTSEAPDSGSHHEGTPCSHCSCAVHVGAVVASTSAVTVADGLQPSIFILPSEQSVPAGLPATIDHPPQLT